MVSGHHDCDRLVEMSHIPFKAKEDRSLAKRSLPDRACFPPVHVLAFRSKGRPVLFMKMNGLYICTLKALPEFGYVLFICQQEIQQSRRDSLVMQLESQLDTLLIGQVELVLNGQLRIVGVDDRVFALFEICFVQPSLICGTKKLTRVFRSDT